MFAHASHSSRRRVIGVAYTLYDGVDRRAVVQDTTTLGRPMVYLEGTRAVPRGLERALVGCHTGQELTLELTPAEAFGRHDPNKVFTVPRALVEDDARPLEVGMPFAVERDDRTLSEDVAYVVAVTDTDVTLDANHPLAGRHVRVDVRVVFAREATPEELRAGMPIPSESPDDGRM